MRWVLFVFACCASPVLASAGCLSEPNDAKRSAYISFAILRCPKFGNPGLAQANIYDDVASRIAFADARCTSELSKIIDEARRAVVTQPNFCWEAKRQRNFGIGSFGKPPASEVIAAARAAVRPDEQVIGAWLDEQSPIGLLVIVQRGAERRYFTAASDATVSRELDDDLGLDEVPASKAKRVWHTKGLTSRPGRKHIDKNGTPHDYDRFVLRADGTLAAFQALEDGSIGDPWMVGRPIDLSSAAN